MRKLALTASLLAAVLCISACNGNNTSGGNSSGNGGAATTTAAGNTVPKNTVNSLDDLKGKAVGVQSGTTGDIFVEDIEDAKVERYDNGAPTMLRSTRT